MGSEGERWAEHLVLTRSRPFLSTVGAFAVNVALFAALFAAVLWYQWAPRDLAA